MFSPAKLLGGVVVLACAGLLAACQGDPVGVTSPQLHPSFAVGGGNSTAAHLCQQGGYLNVLSSTGAGFANTGECVKYAAQGGEFFQRITFSNISLGACNSITFGYTLGGVSTDVYTMPGGCGPFQSYADFSILAPLGTTVDVYLKDNTCGATFSQTSAHALVTGTNPQQIAIADAGGFCESTNPNDPRVPTGGVGNLNVTETIG